MLIFLNQRELIYLFDHEMSMLRDQKGPPPIPLAREIRGEPIVALYYSWYKRVGASLSEKWFCQKQEAQKQKQTQKPIKSTSPPTTPEISAPKRVFEPPPISSGW